MKNMRIAFALALCAGLLAVFSVQAQATALTISFARDFGYASGGGDIQGLFSIKASGPVDLTKVVFYIDDKSMGEVDHAPFNLQFNTDQYALGQHRFYAIGTTAGGQTLKSQVVSASFVSAEAGTQAAMKIVIPILLIVFGSILAAAGIPLLTGRKTIELPAGATRSYLLGGAICPKCKRPFGMHIYGMNLLGSKYDRCPYCGKWSLVSYASAEKLRAAEQAELADALTNASQVQGLSAEENLKRELDESKYRDV